MGQGFAVFIDDFYGCSRECTRPGVNRLFTKQPRPSGSTNFYVSAPILQLLNSCNSCNSFFFAFPCKPQRRFTFKGCMRGRPF